MPHPSYHLLVINIDRYLKEASPNAATAYLARLASWDPVALSGIRMPQQNSEQIAALLDENLDLSGIQAWLTADSQRVAQLARLVRESRNGLREVIAGSEHETAAQLLELVGDDAWSRLLGAGGELPSVLAYRRIWRDRHMDCEEFRQHLGDRDWQEGDWQHFFEKRTWILGYGLRYQFLHRLAGRPYVGGRDFNRQGGQEADFLLATEAVVRFTVLVEIKTPDTELVGRDAYRNRTFPPGRELTASVTQVQQECWHWAVDGSQTREVLDILEPEDILTHEPHGILVIGNLADLAPHRSRVRSFESFRRNLRLPEILTFDELLARAEHMVSAAQESDTESTSVPESQPPASSNVGEESPPPGSVLRFRHVLELEQRRGHDNGAVIGGLDSFLGRWAGQSELVDVLADLLPIDRAYDDSSLGERESLVTRILDAISQIA